MAEVRSGLTLVQGPMTRRGVMRLFAGAAVVTAGSAALAACGSISVPGAYSGSGSGSLNASSAKAATPSSMFSVSGSTVQLVARGAGVGGSKGDDCSFYFGQHSGKGTFTCRVVAQGSASGDGSKGQAGLMIRQAGDAGAPMAYIFTTDGTSGGQFMWRTGQGAAAEEWPMPVMVAVPLPVYLQVAVDMAAASSGSPAGPQVTVSYSTDGKTYQRPLAQPISSAFYKGPYLVGLAASTAVAGAHTIDKFDSINGFKATEYLAVKPSTGSSSSSS